MKIEIERKFLVTGDFKTQAIQHHIIKQGYLSSVPERTVRIRINDSKGYITIKGLGSATGMSRLEWEKEISLEDAEALLLLCESTVISKIRYIVPYNEKTIEIDEFMDENQGLVLAEIELKSENESIILPTWLGQEVTGDKRYYNSYLSQHPFKSWK